MPAGSGSKIEVRKPTLIALVPDDGVDPQVTVGALKQFVHLLDEAGAVEETVVSLANAALEVELEGP